MFILYIDIECIHISILNKHALIRLFLASEKIMFAIATMCVHVYVNRINQIKVLRIFLFLS